MNGPPELAILAGALADGALKATMWLGVAWIGARVGLRRGSAAQRHAVWAAAVAVTPLLPIVAAFRGTAVALDAGPWLGVWAVGAVLTALGPARSLLALGRMTAGAEACPSAPDVRFVAGLDGPVTWGWFRPVVLLPRAAVGWPDGRRRAALAHERAHIARGDWLIHAIGWAVQVVFWFHPAVWWARAALAREAEHAADDAVLAQGIRPSDYASLLVGLGQTDRVGMALGLGRSQVGERVRAVLDVRCRSGRRGGVAIVVALLALTALPVLGGWPAWATEKAALVCLPAP